MQLIVFSCCHRFNVNLFYGVLRGTAILIIETKNKNMEKEGFQKIRFVKAFFAPEYRLTFGVCKFRQQVSVILTFASSILDDKI